MRCRSRTLLVVLLIAFIVVPFGPPRTAIAGQAPEPPGLSSSAAILVDLSSGRVLHERNALQRRAPASLTKVVTALVARDRYQLNDEVTASPLVAQVHGSRLGLEPGMTHTVHDLLYALLLRSGNDAAVALADHHPAGYDHFIELMNEKARSLGAFDSRFANPHGLDAEGLYSTAWDMAIFGRQLLADPVLAQIVSTRSHSIPWVDDTERSFENGNQLLARHEGTLGIKTGFTNQAGRSLLAAVALPEARVLTVVLNAEDHYADTTALFEHAQRIATADASGGTDGPGSDIQAQEADAAPLTLATPPPPPDPVDEPVAAPTVAPLGGAPWTAAAVVLAALMLVVFLVPRRRDAMQEAAALHAYLEPLAGSAEESKRRHLTRRAR